MTRSRRAWWLVYGGCAAVVLAALVWVTETVVRLEGAETRARAGAAHQEALRLALWRMDSWLAPLLAQEAARPYFDYQPFYSQARAYTALLNPIEPGQVLTPSPLLAFDSAYFPLHFQMDPEGRLTSPQAPAGGFRELAEGVYLSEEQLAYNSGNLGDVAGFVTRRQVEACAPWPQPGVEPPPALPPPPQLAQLDQAPSQELLNRQELSKRKGTYQQAITEGQRAQRRAGASASQESVTVGTMVPFWSTGPDGEPELLFTRPVRVAERLYYQGFWCDWPALRRSMLEQIADLLPGAGLVPVRGAAGAAEQKGILLATIPALLEAPPPILPTVGLMTPARLTLALTWAAVLAGMAAVAVTLRASIVFGEKRSRFASAVTHELRTPLTTFRMYSEMLAEGMVRDEQQRQAYLDTLRDESSRLSNLVENVLAYARLEEGRGPARRRTATTLGAVLAQVLGRLRQRAEQSGMALRVANAAPETTPLQVDVEAVGQILFNLVDNACKYGGGSGAGGGEVDLTGEVADGSLSLCVRDHGPGVPRSAAGVIFTPFERGARHDGDPTPGVGLGLALARGMARDLGGNLVLDPPGPEGACFRLTLPVGS